LRNLRNATHASPISHKTNIPKNAVMVSSNSRNACAQFPMAIVSPPAIHNGHNSASINLLQIAKMRYAQVMEKPLPRLYTLGAAAVRAMPQAEREAIYAEYREFWRGHECITRRKSDEEVDRKLARLNQDDWTS
jgi:hypothetical protein